MASLTQPPPPPSASPFWSALSPSARAVLEAKGAAPGETHPALPAPILPPSEPAPVRLPGDRDAGPTRAERRARDAETRHYDRDRRRRRVEERDAQRLRKLRDRTRELTGDRTHPGARLIPLEVFRLMQDVVSDASGASCRIYLRAEGNKVAVGAIRQAALVATDYGCRYTWADLRARRVAALGLALLRLGALTARKGRWSEVVRGIPVMGLAAGLRDPFSGHTPSRAAMAGHHRRGGTVDNGQVGYLVALRTAGLFYRQQLPAAAAERWEVIGPSGYATNRYWIVTSSPEQVRMEVARAWAWRMYFAGAEAGWEAPARMATPTRRSSAWEAQTLATSLALAHEAAAA